MIGERMLRVEDRRLLTGRGTFTDDIRLPDPLYAAFVRSPFASARITVETEAAQGLPGVVAVFTARDLTGRVRPIPLIRRPPNAAALPAIPILADREVRYQGEPVALVVATSREVAYDAVRSVRLRHEPLPTVAHLDEALRPEAPLVHPELGSNVAFHHRLLGGDAAGAFRQADIVLRQRFVNNRLVPLALEPRAAIFWYDPARPLLTVWLGTQRPHHTRWFLAEILGLREHEVRVIAPDVGGAFGSKEPIYPDEVALAFAARELGRPIKWFEDRLENFVATTHGRDQVAELELAARRDGEILAVRGTIHANMGAYLYPNSAGTLLARTGPLLPGCYRFRHIDLTLNGVFTHTTPTGPYRGAGRPEAIYYMERLVDLLARHCGLDPVAVRERNFIRPHEFPFTTATGLTYDSGDYPDALRRVLQRLDYPALRRRQEELRSQGRYLGIGIAGYIELGGATPSRLAALEGSSGLWESALVSADPSGTVTVALGTAGHGQGHETTFAQIAADTLGIPVADVRVTYGDTATAPFGFGTFGSRSTAVGGGALVLACRRLVEQARSLAADLLEADPADVVYEEGRFHVRGVPGRHLTFREVARDAVFSPLAAAHGREPGLVARAAFDPENYTFGGGVHGAVVEVDADTGGVSILDYVAVDDCGRAINPMVVEGQILGGIAQGIGQALLEEARYDAEGNLLTRSLMDYTPLGAEGMPKVRGELQELASPSNPLGAKGVGEAGAIAAPPAVVNAVLDALAPFGVTHLDMPLTSERIWKAMTRKEATA
jgi:carbon-monoxide dehydrogenase large subunit